MRSLYIRIRRHVRGCRTLDCGAFIVVALTAALASVAPVQAQQGRPTIIRERVEVAPACRIPERLAAQLEERPWLRAFMDHPGWLECALPESAYESFGATAFEESTAGALSRTESGADGSLHVLDRGRFHLFAYYLQFRGGGFPGGAAAVVTVTHANTGEEETFERALGGGTFLSSFSRDVVLSEYGCIPASDGAYIELTSPFEIDHYGDTCSPPSTLYQPGLIDLGVLEVGDVIRVAYRAFGSEFNAGGYPYGPETTCSTNGATQRQVWIDAADPCWSNPYPGQFRGRLLYEPLGGLHHFEVTASPEAIQAGPDPSPDGPNVARISVVPKTQDGYNVEAGGDVLIDLEAIAPEGVGGVLEVPGYAAGDVIENIPLSVAASGNVTYWAVATEQGAEVHIRATMSDAPTISGEGVLAVGSTCFPGLARYGQGYDDDGDRTPWADSTYDHSDKTIATLGCALSGMAMAITALGYPVNPGELNAWKKSRPYSEGGFSGESVNWNAVSLYTDSALASSREGRDASNDMWTEEIDDEGNTMRIPNPNSATDLSSLDPYVEQCQPVIVQVANRRNNGSWGQHWVLVTGKTVDGLYTISDPGRNEQYLNAYGGFWGYVPVSGSE